MINNTSTYLVFNVLVDAVEISTDSDMVHANQVSNIIYVLGHVRDASLRSAFHEIIVKRDHYQSAVISLEVHENGTRNSIVVRFERASHHRTENFKPAQWRGVTRNFPLAHGGKLYPSRAFASKTKRTIPGGDRGIDRIDERRKGDLVIAVPHSPSIRCR